MSKTKGKVPTGNPDALFGRIVSILKQARSNVVRAVNTNMVLAYLLIGREIVEDLKGGEERAEYVKNVIADLSARLTELYGKGFSKENIQLFRRSYRVYSERLTMAYPTGTQFDPAGIMYPAGTEPSLPAFPGPPGTESPQGFSLQLSWSHYRALMRVDHAEARAFDEREAVAGGENH